LRNIGFALRRLRPEGAGAIAAQFRQVGGYSELEVRTAIDEVTYSLAAPPELGQLFNELRAAMYEPGKGSWFTGTFSLTPDDKFDFDYDTSSQPQWRRDRKSTRLNSSHVKSSYAVCCLKKKSNRHC